MGSEMCIRDSRFPDPKMYDEWAETAIRLGFSGVASGPLVRSSYKAGLLVRKTQDPNNTETMLGAFVRVARTQIPPPAPLKAEVI